MKRKNYMGQNMPNHTAVYMECFGYFPGEPILSEISGRLTVDVNHLIPRGMGGGDRDFCDNLMGLTREEHNVFENYPKYKEWFKMVHMKFMETRKPYYLIAEDEILSEVMGLSYGTQF
jgi:hypothetical protein